MSQVTSNKPLISVIMPVRNAGDWLKPAVDSILEQEFEDFELLLIDDHSYDGSIETLPEDSRLRIIHHTGTGIVPSLNEGLRQARGQYIARMDGDDISLPNRFKDQLNYAKENPNVGIIGGLVEIFSDDEDVLEGSIFYQDWLNSVQTPDEIHQQIFIESPLVHPSTLIKRGVFNKVGGYRDISWPEDYDLWLRAWLNNIPLGKVPELIFRWREHPNRLTRTDQRYSQKEFIKLKAWALSESYLKDRPAIICGTGQFAAKLCDTLRLLKVEVRGFVDVSPQKIGKTRRELPILSMNQMLETRTNELVLGAVAARGVSQKLKKLFLSHSLRENQDFVMTH